MLGGWVGPNQTKDPVRVLGQGDPGLLAIDDVLINAAYRARFQRGEVRARARLGISLAPPILGGRDPWKKAPLLLRIAEGHDHRPNHLEPEWQQGRGAGGRAFFLENELLNRPPARTPEFLRPVRRSPTVLMENSVPADQLLFRHMCAIQYFVADVFGQAGCDKGSHFFAKRLFRGCEVQVHGLSPRAVNARAYRIGETIVETIFAQLSSGLNFRDAGNGLKLVHVVVDFT